MSTSVDLPLAVETGNVISSSSRSLLDRYSALLASRPLLTKGVTAAIIAGMGDVACQLYTAHRAWEEEAQGENDVPPHHPHIHGGVASVSAPAAAEAGMAKRQQHRDWWGAVDLKRTGKFMLLNAALFAPSAHYWYQVLAKYVKGPTAMGAAVKRMALDQFLFAPVFMGLFFSALMVVEGEAAKIPQKLKQDYWPTLVKNWGIWMPAQLINFRLVPQPYQVLWANGVGFFWNAIMSAQCFKETLDDEEQPVAVTETKLSVAASSGSSGSGPSAGGGSGGGGGGSKVIRGSAPAANAAPLREEVTVHVVPTAAANEQYTLQVRRRGASTSTSP
ncbi:hypothetical protein JKP88DRAFT_351176 [Tribonema minus]|uniref:Uncharacterized protein n=1 Tax=Tribonema minus TaxID=303371 RepID=A0A835YKC9_9STRA|nr:hypothetical protein JKP88DRAFT_351176 [Tribonema minus]